MAKCPYCGSLLRAKGRNEFAEQVYECVFCGDEVTDSDLEYVEYIGKDR